ncbi:hypothetical protein [Aquisalimonas sp.]|uniref:hypothetical protein n=1 Tax=unclassified Aquisalimonas TaxID=2644645 RepID=UPI0025C186E1|nr:hypothetical protein [Aquisalimonas sp.]
MNPRDVVDAYLQAILDRDPGEARRWLADTGFYYRSPIETLECAEALVNQSFMSSGIVHHVRMRKVFADGADVCHVMEFTVQISDKFTVDLMHWATVEQDRIQRIETIFDASRYRELFPVE